MGERAHELFPGGVLVDGRGFDHAVAETAALLARADVPAIFEAAFVQDGVRIRVDVLERLPGGAWGLREVKSSARAKEVHLEDVAVQQYVLERAGLRVTSVELIHVDTRYTRGAGPIDWRQFFGRVDLTALSRKRQAAIPALIAGQHGVLAAAAAPAVEPFAHCWSPYGCEFWEHCTAAKPDDWIYRLPQLRSVRKEELRAAGIERIGDIPAGTKLGAIPDRVRDVLRTGAPFVSPDLGTALASFGPPAFYLGFETMSPAIPRYPLTRPYGRVPFQWSLHRIGADGVLTHQGFLADGRDDPRRALAESLLAALEPGTEPILVYSSFESGVLDELATALPDLAMRLRALQPRLRDLLQIVRGHVYHPDFRYSFSLKNVAPALVPGFGYRDLDGIADGGAASYAFPRLIDGAVPADEEARLRRALLAYCERDTLALVELHRALRALAVPA